MELHRKGSKKDGEQRDKWALYFKQESGPCPLDWRITIHSYIDLVFFQQYLQICDYVGKLPEQHVSEWLFSNLGDKILFLLTFNEVRILELNIYYPCIRNLLYVCWKTEVCLPHIRFTILIKFLGNTSSLGCFLRLMQG